MFQPPPESKQQLIALSSQEFTKPELTTTPLRKQDIPQTGLPHLMVTRSVSPFTIWGTIDELETSKCFENADSIHFRELPRRSDELVTQPHLTRHAAAATGSPQERFYLSPTRLVGTFIKNYISGLMLLVLLFKKHQPSNLKPLQRNLH